MRGPITAATRSTIVEGDQTERRAARARPRLRVPALLAGSVLVGSTRIVVTGEDARRHQSFPNIGEKRRPAGRDDSTVLRRRRGERPDETGGVSRRARVPRRPLDARGKLNRRRGSRRSGGTQREPRRTEADGPSTGRGVNSFDPLSAARAGRSSRPRRGCCTAFTASSSTADEPATSRAGHGRSEQRLGQHARPASTVSAAKFVPQRLRSEAGPHWRGPGLVSRNRAPAARLSRRNSCSVSSEHDQCRG